MPTPGTTPSIQPARLLAADLGPDSSSVIASVQVPLPAGIGPPGADGGLATMAIAMSRQATQRGPGRGRWAFHCPTCGRRCAALYAPPSAAPSAAPWLCRACRGLVRPVLLKSRTAEERVARGLQPRRKGEPVWRWRARRAEAEEALKALKGIMS
jgi:hypothetical protein